MTRSGIVVERVVEEKVRAFFPAPANPLMRVMLAVATGIYAVVVVAGFRMMHPLVWMVFALGSAYLLVDTCVVTFGATALEINDERVLVSRTWLGLRHHKQIPRARLGSFRLRGPRKPAGLFAIEIRSPDDRRLHEILLDRDLPGASSAAQFLNEQITRVAVE